MYEKGTVKWGVSLDSTANYEDITGAYLPHSCESWVIGDVDHIRMMIEDLQEILRQAEGG